MYDTNKEDIYSEMKYVFFFVIVKFHHQFRLLDDCMICFMFW